MGSMGWFLMTAMSTFVGHLRHNPDYVNGSPKLLLFDVRIFLFTGSEMHFMFHHWTPTDLSLEPGFISVATSAHAWSTHPAGAGEVEGAGRRSRSPASSLGQQNKMQWCRLVPAWLGKQHHRIVQVGKRTQGDHWLMRSVGWWLIYWSCRGQITDTRMSGTAQCTTGTLPQSFPKLLAHTRKICSPVIRRKENLRTCSFTYILGLQGLKHCQKWSLHLCKAPVLQTELESCSCSLVLWAVGCRPGTSRFDCAVLLPLADSSTFFIFPEQPL